MHEQNVLRQIWVAFEDRKLGKRRLEHGNGINAVYYYKATCCCNEWFSAMSDGLVTCQLSASKQRHNIDHDSIWKAKNDQPEDQLTKRDMG